MKKNFALSIALLISTPIVCKEARIEKKECRECCDWDGLTLHEFTTIMSWELQVLCEEVGREVAEALEKQCPGILEWRLRWIEKEAAQKFAQCGDGMAKIALIKQQKKQLRDYLFSPIRSGEVERLQMAAQYNECQNTFWKKRIAQ